MIVARQLIAWKSRNKDSVPWGRYDGVARTCETSTCWAEIQRWFLRGSVPIIPSLRDGLPLFLIPGTSYLVTFILALRDKTDSASLTLH